MTFFPSGLAGMLRIPYSKSECIRAMLLAASCGSICTIHGVTLPYCDDTLAAVDACRLLGTEVQTKENGLTVVPGNQSGNADINLRSCASAFRMILPYCMQKPVRSLIRIDHGLERRVFPEASQIAKAFGGSCSVLSTSEDSCTVEMTGSPAPIACTVDAANTSQYLSGALMASAVNTDFSIPHTVYGSPDPASKPYIDLTLHWMRRFGIKATSSDDGVYHICSGFSCIPKEVYIPSDWTSTAFMLCADALGAHIQAYGLEAPESTPQGDSSIVSLMEHMGLRYYSYNDSIMIGNPSRAALKPIHVDLSDTPDLFPYIAVVCASASGTSVLSGAERLVMKECNRLEALLELLNALGCKARYLYDQLTIPGIKHFKGGFSFDSRGDHRMVMAAVLASTVADAPITISDAACVSKSWPTFLDDYQALGGYVE